MSGLANDPPKWVQFIGYIVALPSHASRLGTNLQTGYAIMLD